MGLFNFNTIRTWDVALHHGHSAFRLLRIVYEIETEYIQCQEQLKVLPFGQLDYLHTLGRTLALTTDMFRISAASIMMFQAMMEALINDSLERENQLTMVSKRGKFREKWGESLDVLKQDRSPFEKYHEAIYKKYRNVFVHPTDIHLNSFNDLSFKELQTGFYHGWEAYVKLYDGLGYPHDDNSWQVMCQAYQVPHNL